MTKKAKKQATWTVIIIGSLVATIAIVASKWDSVKSKLKLKLNF